MAIAIAMTISNNTGKRESDTNAYSIWTVSPLSLFKNPMILLAVFAMVVMFAMPKLMENSTSRPFSCYLLPFFTYARNRRDIPIGRTYTCYMDTANVNTVDPEMREEFEKQSRGGPLSAAGRSAVQGGGPANFDLAGWMAGTTSSASAADGSSATTSGRESGGAGRRRG